MVVGHVADDLRGFVTQSTEGRRGRRWLSKRKAAFGLRPAFLLHRPIADRAFDVEENDVGAAEKRPYLSQHRIGVRTATEPFPQSGFRRPCPDRIEVASERDVSASAKPESRTLCRVGCHGSGNDRVRVNYTDRVANLRAGWNGQGSDQPEA